MFRYYLYRYTKLLIFWDICKFFDIFILFGTGANFTLRLLISARWANRKRKRCAVMTHPIPIIKV